MKVEVGDKLKLKNRRGECWLISGEMDKYIGKTVTISKVYRNDEAFNIDDNEGWMFNFADIEYVVKQKHFKSLPNNFTGTIEVENGFIKEILDETEKEYLKEVIRPCKDKIKFIFKKEYKGCYYIKILLNNDEMSLPNFEKETMYKGMEVDKKYTLKELGL